jgi:hypothetical protein
MWVGVGVSENRITFEEFKESMANHQCNSCPIGTPTECNPDCMECFAKFVEWNVRKGYEKNNLST